MINLNAKYESLIKTLNDVAPFTPDLAVVLGSGLGDFAASVEIVKSIETRSLPGYPASTIAGHQGVIHFARYEGKNLLLFQGRIHFYEGYRISECILPVFIAHKLNARSVILTNAAGGINTLMKPGDFMLNTSFNSTNIKKELTDLLGLASYNAKKAFMDFPSSALNGIIIKAALEQKIHLHQGVYWYSKGPVYETPAEVEMIRRFGGDAVGMSTVHEAVFAATLGMHVSSISCITNYAAGISPVKLSHSEVTETANRVKHEFEAFIKRIITLL